MKIDISTEKTDNDNEIKFILRDSVEIARNSVRRQILRTLRGITPMALYQGIDRNYRWLFSPFSRNIGEFEIFINKNETSEIDLRALRTSLLEFVRFNYLTTLFPLNKTEKIVLFNKFYVKGEVKRDSQTVMKGLLTTTEKPYKMSLYMPDILNKIFRDIHTFEVTANHIPGQMLEIISNDERLKGLKMYKTGKGNERELELNGRKLGQHDYNLTDNYFKTKVK